MHPEQKPGERLVVRDAATMRALAHPARITSLEHLMRGGPATATELAEVAGLTPSAMSYHLRLLERAGLITAAPGRGDGRERVWQSEQTGGWSHDSAGDTAQTRAVSVVGAGIDVHARRVGGLHRGSQGWRRQFRRSVFRCAATFATARGISAARSGIDEVNVDAFRFGCGSRTALWR
jgi:DNA-binding transcriptional ArsR family regulator